MKLTQLLLIGGLSTLPFAAFATDTGVPADEATSVVTIQPNAQVIDEQQPVYVPEAPTTEASPDTAGEDETAHPTESEGEQPAE